MTKAVLAAALCLCSVALAAEVDDLRGRLERARGEATELAARIRATQERLLATRGEAAAAAARERRVSGLLAAGRERAAELAARAARTRERLEAERRRLRRARRVLARRLVAMYKAGAPDTTGLVLGSDDYEELAARTDYLARIEDSDRELAERVAAVRDAVRASLRRVRELEARVAAENRRLDAARRQIAEVRAAAEASAARLAALERARSAGLAALRSRIGTWVRRIEAAEAASRAAAEETVGRWLGGPYAIPTYIVMCESGGNYGALNPSSGAGGAYQILPSTWRRYGGKGAPHEASKAEQDRIAAQIWADSGGSAWVCAG